MVKRAISGKGRRGAPPLPRQRGALRVVQLTLLALAAFLGYLAYESWLAFAGVPRRAGFGEVLGVGLLAAASLLGAVGMGLRTVRGPRPPELD